MNARGFGLRPNARLALVLLLALCLLLPAAAPAAAATPVAANGATSDSPANIQLVAVQMRWNMADFASEERLAARVEGLMDRVDKRLDPRYPALVVFPEDVGILTAFLDRERLLQGVNTMQGAVEKMVKAHFLSVLWNRLRYRVGWVRGVFLTRHQDMANAYLQVFSEAARRHHVYLVAGSAPLPDYPLPADGTLPKHLRPASGQVHNVSYLFGPDGRIFGRQKKVNLIDIEGAGGLDLVPGRAEDLQVVDTPLGRVGIAICLDAFKEPVLKRLQSLGAQILVQPSANPAPWSREQQDDWLRGSWRAVAEEGRFAYAVNPMMTGQVLNLSFFGQSSIVFGPGGWGVGAPLGYQATGPARGFAAVAKGADTEEILVVKAPHPGAGKH